MLKFFPLHVGVFDIYEMWTCYSYMEYPLPIYIDSTGIGNIPNQYILIVLHDTPIIEQQYGPLITKPTFICIV